MTDAVPHQLMNDDTLELDTLSPRDREVVERISADLDKIVAESFIGPVDGETMQQQAERLVESMNADPDRLREFAEAMTNNAVESCRVVLDGIQDGNLLLSYQVDFAKSGPRFEEFQARKESIHADAVAKARAVLQELSPPGEDEGGVTVEGAGAAIASLVTGDHKAGDSFVVGEGEDATRVDVIT